LLSPGKQGKGGKERVYVHHEHALTHNVNALGAQVSQRLLIVGNMLQEIACACFDILAHRQGLNSRPPQPGSLNKLLQKISVSNALIKRTIGSRKTHARNSGLELHGKGRKGNVLMRHRGHATRV